MISRLFRYVEQKAGMRRMEHTCLPVCFQVRGTDIGKGMGEVPLFPGMSAQLWLFCAVPFFMSESGISALV